MKAGWSVERCPSLRSPYNKYKYLLGYSCINIMYNTKTRTAASAFSSIICLTWKTVLNWKLDKERNIFAK